MTLRERLARWLFPAAFAAPATDHPAVVVASALETLPPGDGPKSLRVPDPLRVPVEPPEIPPEYDAAISLHWGDSPIAAARTRSFVRTLLHTAGPRLSRDDVFAACRGNVTEIE